MIERKTLRQWMIELGYKWSPGQERLLKGEITCAEATQQLHDLAQKGVVERA